jgi:hypothetical protein
MKLQNDDGRGGHCPLGNGLGADCRSTRRGPGSPEDRSRVAGPTTTVRKVWSDLDLALTVPVPMD